MYYYIRQYYDEFSLVMKLDPSVCMLCIIMPSSHAGIMCPLCELLCIGRMIADGCGGVSGRSCDPHVSFHLLEGAGGSSTP